MIRKPIRYSDHLQDRLVLPHIERDLPERIIHEAQHSFTDTTTGYRIAVATVVYRGAEHLVMVAFEETESEIVAAVVTRLTSRTLKGKSETEGG